MSQAYDEGEGSIMDYIIRHARLDDYERILQIYARARDFMRETGNPRQWNTKWPPEELIQEDIQLGRNYVCEVDGRVQGVFVYIQGIDIDPTYRTINSGSWMDGDKPVEYGVVHRVASSGEVKGIGSYCIKWAYEQCGHLRIDTHGDNVVMRNLLKQLGFEERGIIYVVEDNDPRIAFEKRR